MAIIITVLGPGKRAATINFQLRGDEFSAFSRDTFVSITAIIVFQLAGIHPFIASSAVLIALSYFYRGIPFESQSHENLSIRKSATFPCAEIKIRLVRLALHRLLLITESSRDN